MSYDRKISEKPKILLYLVIIYAISVLIMMVYYAIANWKYIETLGDLLFPTSGRWCIYGEYMHSLCLWISKYNIYFIYKINKLLIFQVIPKNDT